MPLVQILVGLIIVGVLLWLINTYIPMQPPIPTIINIVVVLVLILWLANVFGLMTATVPRYR